MAPIYPDCAPVRPAPWISIDILNQVPRAVAMIAVCVHANGESRDVQSARFQGVNVTDLHKFLKMKSDARKAPKMWKSPS